MKPPVSVVILSFNRREALGRSLRALTACAEEWDEVIVVDNASGDGSARMVESRFPGVRLVRLGRNRGISAWNEGFRAARGDCFFVLDDDSYPAPGAISAALAYARANPRVGIVACRVLHPETRCCVTDHLAQEAYRRGSSPSYLVNDFVGCGALITRRLYEAVGGFEPDIFIYAHELEYSMRALSRGFQTHYLPGAAVYHDRAFRDKRKEGFFCIHSARNRLLAVRRFCPQPLAGMAALYLWLRHLPDFLRNGWVREWLSLGGMALLPGRAGANRCRRRSPVYLHFARRLLAPSLLRALVPESGAPRHFGSAAQVQE